MPTLINKKNPRLCFAGNMLGRNAGFITTQGETVARLFAAEDYNVVCVSSKINKAARLFEIVAVLIKNRRKFDIVILDVYSGLNLIMAETVGWLCRRLKLPLIMVLHGGNLPEHAEKNPRMMQRILRRADRLAAPSRFLAEKVGASGFQINVVPNVLDIESYSFKERSEIAPKLFWMRSFHPLYNPQMAVEVLAKLKEKFPRATLTMAGVDKGIECEIKAKVSALNLSQSIRFAGWLDEKEKRKEFENADIFINTNRIDNMPVSVLEAGAAGLPVVATEVGGVPYLLSDGKNGLLVPNDDAAAMTQAVSNLLENPELTQKLSKNGRKLAEKSAWKNVRRKWEKLFDEVLEEKAVKSSASMPADFKTGLAKKI